ncbi:MAG: carbon monoxide dehydrogenase subunit G [Burkholderiaceae bacterium]
MQLTGERVIPANIDKTWTALNSPETLKACIKGCETLEQTSEDEFTAALKIRIGPVNAKFKAKLFLENVVPQKSYTIRFEGQGGIAGFGKGSADVVLQAHGDNATLLKYEANANVGGKIAQVGSRLVDSAAAKISEEFFTEFEKQLTES